MNIGYARVSKAGDAQNLDLQYDALAADGVAREFIYEDRASGKKDSRPGLDACLKALREGDTLVVWKLDRLGRDLHHLVSVVQELTEHGIGPACVGRPRRADRHGNPGGPPCLRHLRCPGGIRARTDPRAHHRRTRGCPRQREGKGGRKFALTKAQVRLAQAAMQKP